MTAFAVENELLPVEALRSDNDPAAKAPPERHAALDDVDLEVVALPANPAGADLERIGVARQRTPAALGHRPELAAGSIQSDVDRDVVFGVGRAAGARRIVVGREDAADERNDDDSGVPVVADSVDVPPSVPVHRYRHVEARPDRPFAAVLCRLHERHHGTEKAPDHVFRRLTTKRRLSILADR